MRHTVRPLSDTTWLRPMAVRRPTPFDSSWSQTLDLLEREVGHLDASEFVLGLEVAEKDIRLDGQIRANARPGLPAVEVAFTSASKGPLLYRCDLFVARYSGSEDWHHNVRAIAKTLEMLRAIERYGAADSGEQYTGYRQITAAPEKMSRDSALVLLSKMSGATTTELDTSPDMVRVAARQAARWHHPDVGGNVETWHQLQAAIEVLKP